MAIFSFMIFISNGWWIHMYVMRSSCWYSRYWWMTRFMNLSPITILIRRCSSIFVVKRWDLNVSLGVVKAFHTMSLNFFDLGLRSTTMYRTVCQLSYASLFTSCLVLFLDEIMVIKLSLLPVLESHISSNFIVHLVKQVARWTEILLLVWQISDESRKTVIELF